MNMRFSGDDPFDIPNRYSNFAIITSGHSPCASNFIYGQIDGWPIRAFDFRFELGHGTRRQTSYYHIIVLETDLQLPELIMWNDNDPQTSPLSISLATGRFGCWSVRGDDKLAQALQGAFAEIGDTGLGIEILGKNVMLCVPAANKRVHLETKIEQVAQTLRGVLSRWRELEESEQQIDVT